VPVHLQIHRHSKGPAVMTKTLMAEH
jgi:hypothetical protein